jgi:hypothetical protein
MFQELGRMARYTAGESMHTLPIAFLHDGTLRELKKRLDTHTALQSMKMKVWQLGPLHARCLPVGLSACPVAARGDP